MFFFSTSACLSRGTQSTQECCYIRLEEYYGTTVWKMYDSEIFVLTARDLSSSLIPTLSLSLCFPRSLYFDFDLDLFFPFICTCACTPRLLVGYS